MSLEDKDATDGALLLPMTTELPLRMVRVYKHLGAQALPTATLATERAYRSQLAFQMSGVVRATLRSRVYNQSAEKLRPQQQPIRGCFMPLEPGMCQ